MKKLSILLFLLTLLSFQISDQRSIYLLPKVSSGVTAADYDMDGDMDIIVNHPQEGQTNWGGTYILENDGYGQFIFYDSIYDTVGYYNKVGHLTGQTYPDIVSEARDSIRIISTNGASLWVNRYYVGPGVKYFDLGDINNDGLLDILFCSSGFGFQYWGMLINENEGNFSEPTYVELDFPIINILCEDINNDSINDIILIGSESKVLINHESYFEEIVLGYTASRAIVNDFDNNGEKDIIAYVNLINKGRISIIINNSNTFDSVIEFFIPFACTDYTINDINLDGFGDLVLQTPHTYESPGFYIFYNQGNFKFSDTLFVPADWMGETSRFMDCADMDGNGYDDLILSRQVIDISLENSPLEIFFNDGNGNFGGNPLTSYPELSADDKIEINCYPNPFIHECTIEFNFKTNNRVNVSICNLSGQIVKDLSNENINSGNKIIWNGTDKNGKEVNPGIYIISLVTGRQTTSCRIIKNN